MKKPFATTIEEDIQRDFKSVCAKSGMPMNIILERFMYAYSQGRFKIEIEYESSIDKN